MPCQAIDILTKKRVLDEVDKGTKYELIAEKFVTCINTLKLFAAQGGTKEETSDMLKLIRNLENKIFDKQINMFGFKD
ncbi:hypothetical protein BpHYR1_011101 [Brachionus plicatilis]|uniref:Uncharacterized protein n=1 Tax=Brachionus plicatilis TaxID=10195 RepID=A0A3M7PW76_BRAPC|nr:hypothetical protein BpHYR1_011101 [Brachionus plicatilis]